MAYENLKLGVSPLTKTIFAGRVSKKGGMWIDKVDITEQFLRCCMEYFEPNTENTIYVNGKPEFIIIVKKAE